MSTAPVLRPLLALAWIFLSMAQPSGAQTGVIEGSLALEQMPVRRTASRYPSGPTAARPMQAVRAVVYLEGEGLTSVRESVPAPTVVDLVQRDTVFTPSAIVVRAGSVVRFPNADPFFHNVFSYAANARFDLGRYPGGASREVRFEAVGIARVFCEVHESMRAVVVVTDHSFHAVVGDDGAFRIAGVPPGTYTLVAYHPDAGRVVQSVTVGATSTVRVQVVLRG